MKALGALCQLSEKRHYIAPTILSLLESSRSLTCCQHRLLVRFRHLKRSAERSQSTVAGESGPKPNSIATDPCDSSSARYHLATVSQASAPTRPPFLSRRMLPRILLFVVLSNLSIRYREGSHRISSLNSS